MLRVAFYYILLQNFRKNILNYITDGFSFLSFASPWPTSLICAFIASFG